MDWLFDEQMTRVVGLLLAAVISGAASMVVFRWVSPKQRLKDLKIAMQQVQAQMKNYEGDFAGLWSLVKQNLSLATRQLGLSIGPSLVAGLPVLLVGFNLDVIHRQLTPRIDRVQQATSHTTGGLSRSGHASPAYGDNDSQVADELGAVSQKAIGQNTGSPDLNKRATWQPELLISARVGQSRGLNKHSLASDVTTGALRSLEYCPWGPIWLRSWIATFVLGSTIGACSIQFCRGSD